MAGTAFDIMTSSDLSTRLKIFHDRKQKKSCFCRCRMMKAACMRRRCIVHCIAMAKRSLSVSVFVFLALRGTLLATSFTLRPRPTIDPSLVVLRGGDEEKNEVESSSSTSLSKTARDFTDAACSLFGNLRIPAALFAGASAGAAFSMPLAEGDGLKLGMVKRTYALLMVGSLSSQIIVLIVATMTLARLAMDQPREAATMSEYLHQNYDLEWVTARLHFLSGLLMFVTASGLRAWISIACPVVAKGAVGIIASSTLLAIAFINMVERRQSSAKGMLDLPIRFVQLLWQQIQERDLWFLAATISATVTGIFLASNIRHVWIYLATKL